MENKGASYTKDYRARKRKAGLCKTCSSPIASYGFCDRHLEHHRKAMREYQRKVRDGFRAYQRMQKGVVNDK